MITDKVKESTSTPKKTKLEALAMFEDALKQELAAKANKNGAIDNSWQTMIGDSLQALRVEELDRIRTDDGQDALETELDKLLLNKDEAGLTKIVETLDQRESPKLLEHCVRKLLGTNEGKKALESKTHLSMNALKVVRDPKLAADLLGSINLTALGGQEYLEFVKSLGDKKDDILIDAMKAISQRPLPTDPLQKEFAVNDQSKSFDDMAQELDPANFAKMAKAMLNSKEGKQALAANPKTGGYLLSRLTSKDLENVDFDASLGPAKNDVLAEAMVMLSEKPLADGKVKPPETLDPKLFKLLASKIDATAWNDKAATTGAARGWELAFAWSFGTRAITSKLSI